MRHIWGLPCHSSPLSLLRSLLNRPAPQVFPILQVFHGCPGSTGGLPWGLPRDNPFASLASNSDWLLHLGKRFPWVGGIDQVRRSNATIKTSSSPYKGLRIAPRQGQPVLSSTNHPNQVFSLFSLLADCCPSTYYTMGLFRKASLSRPEGEAGNTWPVIAMGFFAAFGGVLFGYGMMISLLRSVPKG